MENKKKNNGRRIQITITEKGLTPLLIPLKRPVKAIYILLDHALKHGYVSKDDLYYYMLTYGSKFLFKGGSTEKEMLAMKLSKKPRKAV